MKKRKAIAKVSRADVDLTMEFVRAKLATFEKRHPLTTNRERISALLTLKKVHGLLSRTQKLMGNQPRERIISAADKAVIDDAPKYGSLLSSVKAHVAAGKLSPHTQPQSHYIRILSWKNAQKTKNKRPR